MSCDLLSVFGRIVRRPAGVFCGNADITCCAESQAVVLSDLNDRKAQECACVCVMHGSCLSKNADREIFTRVGVNKTRRKVF